MAKVSFHTEDGTFLGYAYYQEVASLLEVYDTSGVHLTAPQREQLEQALFNGETEGEIGGFMWEITCT